MSCRGAMWDFEPSVDTLEAPGRGGEERSDHDFTLTELEISDQNWIGLLQSLSEQQSPASTDFLLVRDGYFPGKSYSSWFQEPLLPSQLQVSSWWPGRLSFAQRWYSNQWSNREMLLLLVENYTQYPALLVWNITSWGNFWRPQLELFVEV